MPVEKSPNNQPESWWERDGFSDLHIAAYNGDADSVGAILSEGANPNDLDLQGNTPLYWACFKAAVSPEYTEVVRMLLQSGAAVDRRGPGAERPLFVACRAGVGEVVGQLIRAGADVQTPCGNRAAIAVAAEGGSVECVEALLAAGADPRGRGVLGLTAREWAESHGFDRIVAILDAASRPRE